MIAGKSRPCLTVHNFVGKFTVTTLLVFLMISGSERNPGPNSLNEEASMASACASGDKSKPTETCTTDQSTAMQQIFQSVQSLALSIE